MGKMKNQLERGAVHSYRTHHHFDRPPRANRLTSRIECENRSRTRRSAPKSYTFAFCPRRQGQIGSHRAARAQIVDMRSESGREGRLCTDSTLRLLSDSRAYTRVKRNAQPVATQDATVASPFASRTPRHAPQPPARPHRRVDVVSVDPPPKTERRNVLSPALQGNCP